MGDEEIKEASWAAKSVAGYSAYLYGTGYSKEKYKEEVDATVEYIKKSSK